jgi:hypothetical protein
MTSSFQGTVNGGAMRSIVSHDHVSGKPLHTFQSEKQILLQHIGPLRKSTFPALPPMVLFKASSPWRQDVKVNRSRGKCREWLRTATISGRKRSRLPLSCLLIWRRCLTCRRPTRCQTANGSRIQHKHRWHHFSCYSCFRVKRSASVDALWCAAVAVTLAVQHQPIDSTRILAGTESYSQPQTAYESSPCDRDHRFPPCFHYQ